MLGGIWDVGTLVHWWREWRWVRALGEPSGRVQLMNTTVFINHCFWVPLPTALGYALMDKQEIGGSACGAGGDEANCSAHHCGWSGRM